MSDITSKPLPDLLFDPNNIRADIVDNISNVESNSNKELSKTNRIYGYPVELGCRLVFFKNATFGSKNLLELPISNIISCEITSQKKMIGTKWFCNIKTAGDTISIESTENLVNGIKLLIEQQKEKQKLQDLQKQITFTENNSSKTITINPYSPCKQNGEEHLYSISTGYIGYLVTNYRVYQNAYYFHYDKGRIATISLTHGEYEDVFASNVQKVSETDTTGGVDSKPSLMNFLPYQTVYKQYNKTTLHSSAVEAEYGNITFMNDGKQVMVWENFPDPNSVVQMIKSAKSHFKSTSSDVSAPAQFEDPLKALKLRFVKGEISKEEFEEMKNMIE